MKISKINQIAYNIEITDNLLKTPFFLPSISSVRTNYSVHDYLRALVSTGYPGFLISAYDIYHDENKKLLLEGVSNSTEGSTFTLLDSGNYESYWYKDNEWDIEKFGSVLKDIDVDSCFSFDFFLKRDTKLKSHIETTIDNSVKTASLQRGGTTIPIIHIGEKGYIETIDEVVNAISPQIIGITERELGPSLLERAKKLSSIRGNLERNGNEIPIHLLGTGNPISLLIFTLCGANLFDGLEWCKTVVDPNTGHLHHFVQRDLINCKCKACETADVPYSPQTMWHNLIFYQKFTTEINKAVEGEDVSELMKKYLPKRIMGPVKKIVGLK